MKSVQATENLRCVRVVEGGPTVAT